MAPFGCLKINSVYLCIEVAQIKNIRFVQRLEHFHYRNRNKFQKWLLSRIIEFLGVWKETATGYEPKSYNKNIKMAFQIADMA